LKEEENLYKWMGQDGFLGTSDDKYVISETNNWPENITDFVADEIRIKTEAGETEDIQIKIGTQIKFIAEVYFRGQLIADHEVIWSINGQSDTNTTISEDGVLYVGGNESVGRTINVIASSKQKPNKLTKHITITVINLGYEDIPNVEVGSDTTVRIGNYDYYVLANDGYKALLWMKNSYLTAMYFGSSGSNWENSGARQFLTDNISTFIPNNLMNKIVETELTTRYYASDGIPLSSPSFVTTRDKLFLLSYEDLFGTSSNTGTLDRNDLYTANGKLGDAYDLPSNNQVSWLRTNYIDNRAYLLNNITVPSSSNYAIVHWGSYYLRPAFWIQLP
ncbi:MAG: hypothetical protein K2L08_03710, partial [Erysipelotrichaceae bacterium]|nr:hypothetical protein [Erysipelotrichaceae bacterium]